MTTSTNKDSNSGAGDLIIRQSGADTDGQLLEMEAIYRPHSEQPRYHYHPYQEEKFQVLQGTFHTKIGDVEKTYETGELFNVPVNTSHWMHNVSDEEGRLLWQVRPAMKTQAFLETMRGLEANGKTNANGLPNLLQLAVILRSYRDEFRATSPPYPIQRVLFGILAPIGRLFGYRASYERYGGKGS